MKKILLLVAMATTMTFLWANVTYANMNDVSCMNDFNTEESFNHNKSNSASNASSCASSCHAVNSGNDCGNVVYEVDDFPGSAHHSTLGGDGSGTGCQYYGYTSPYVLGAGSGSSYTLCTQYTASSVEASYVTYLNAGSSSCINRSLSLYKANTCSTPSAVNLEQPINTYPGRARGLTIGESYVVCHTYTESACSSDFYSGIFEACMTISEAAYCSSSVSPQPVTACSGEDFQITLDNCTVDTDLSVAGGTPGYAALFYSTNNGTTFSNFPANSTAEDISSNINYKFYDDSNYSTGGGCTPIDIRGIINTGCEPLVIPVGIVSLDVSSVNTPILQILPDCPIVETTITIYPQFTSQVTGSSIQLIAEDGTVCETYSTTTTIPTLSVNIPSNTLQNSVLNADVFNTNGSFSTSIGQNQTVQTIVPINPIESGAGIPDDIPCITPSGLLAPNANGNALLAHTVDANEEGQLVFTYQMPVQKAAVYPNPAAKQLFFTTAQAETYTVRIYDTFGKQVYIGQTTDNAAISINHLPTGLYTYALENAQQNIFDHGKWVKQ